MLGWLVRRRSERCGSPRLDASRPPLDEVRMGRRSKRKLRFPVKLDYTTKVHLKRRVERIDYRFILAMIVLAGGVAAATRII